MSKKRSQGKGKIPLPCLNSSDDPAQTSSAILAATDSNADVTGDSL